MYMFFLTTKVKNIIKLIILILILILFILEKKIAIAYTNPRFASIIMDVNNNKIIYAKNSQNLRYPASLTKIMTLYIIFEELKQNRIKKYTKILISKYAALQQPSKLYLKKGSWITVENAIKALITKSANDVAVAMAEHISGTEKSFANKMTKIARSIGMKNTTFKNASGLPNKLQVTTAKDMAILGIKIQNKFPIYYKYFKTRIFIYKGIKYYNNNKLLWKYKGINGIKTGYTYASGFNLVSAIKYNNKNIIAVVIGAKSSKSRYFHMKQLLNKAFNIKKISFNLKYFSKKITITNYSSNVKYIKKTNILNIKKYNWSVQLGAFIKYKNAKEKINQFNQLILKNNIKYYISNVKKNNKILYRTRLIKLSKKYAIHICNIIKSYKYNCLIIKEN